MHFRGYKESLVLDGVLRWHQTGVVVTAYEPCYTDEGVSGGMRATGAVCHRRCVYSVWYVYGVVEFVDKPEDIDDHSYVSTSPLFAQNPPNPPHIRTPRTLLLHSQRGKIRPLRKLVESNAAASVEKQTKVRVDTESRLLYHSYIVLDN